MIRTSVFILILAVVFFGCKDQNTIKKHLETGLIEYKRVRTINKNFNKGYEINKIGFFKLDSTSYQFVLLLNDQITRAKVANYSLGLHAYVDPKYLINNKDFLVWDIKPELVEAGKFKYIIKEVHTPIKRIDSMFFFLYDRDTYRGIIGNRVRVRNVGL